MSSRSTQIIGGPDDTRAHAHVDAATNALKVFNVNSGGGGGTSDVNIIEIAGNAISGANLPVAIQGLPAEDGVVAAGHDVYPMGVVQDAALSSLPSADGDWTNLRVSGRGALWVEPATTWPCSINAQTIDVSIDDGGNSITVDDGGGSLTVDGTVAISGTVAVTQSGAWTVTVQEPLSVDDGGGSLTIDGTVSISGEVDVDLNSLSGLPAEDEVAGAGQKVFPVGVIQDAALTALTSADGDWTSARVNARGALWVEHDGVLSIDDNGGSITVDGTVAATQSGAWSVEATQTTHDDLNANANLQVGDVDVANGNPVPVSDAGGTLSVDDGGGSLTVDGTVSISGTVPVSITEPLQVDTPSLEDVAVPGGHAVFPAGAERDDSLATLAIVEGDWTHLRVSSRGALWVEMPSTLSVNLNELAALPHENDAVVGGDEVFPAGVVRDDALTTLGVADGDWTHMRTNARGALWVEHDGVLSIDDNGGSLTVDGTVAATQSGAWTVTIQDGGNVISVDDGGGSLTVDGTVAVSSVAGTVAVTQSGAWTVTIQEPLSIDDNGGSITVDGTVAATQSGSWTVTIQDGGNVISVDDGGGSLTVDGTVSVSGNVDLSATQTENAVVSGGHEVFPAGAVRDDALATLGVADGDWTNIRTNDRGALWVQHDGDVEVVQPTHDDLQANVTLQLQDTDIVAGAGASTTRTARIPVSEYGIDNLPNFYANVGSAYNIPATILADPTAGTVAAIDTPTLALRTGPARVGPTSLFSSQVLNNTTTSANSSLVDLSLYRHALIFLDMANAGTPTALRILAQFSNDGGTSWFNYSVDQWTDLRYVPAQLSLSECVPLNYVIGQDFRLRIIGSGTTASDTFTVSAWVEGIT